MNEREKTIRLWFDMWLNQQDMGIEQWIHEIKTPITAMKLLCENHRMDWTKELLLELEKTNRFTEQALYYARSEHTEKDYSVREMALSQVVHGAIADNKYLLLQSGMRLEVEEMQDTVYSDEKWVRFIHIQYQGLEQIHLAGIPEMVALAVVRGVLDDDMLKNPRWILGCFHAQQARRETAFFP